MSNKRTQVSEILKGDKFESQHTGKVFEIEHVIDGGEFVVYKKPSDSGYGVTEGTAFTRPHNYKLVVPFFEVGKKYKYKGSYGSPGSDTYQILAVTEHEGKKVALHVEVSHSGDEWFGSFSEGDFKNYGNEVSA